MTRENQLTLTEMALQFHEAPQPGKIEIIASKPLRDKHDLSLAYSPGVAIPCEAIAIEPAAAYRYTGKGNLVAVISNGTAVLGLGHIGALASKPVMEGKSVLFKRFAGINSIDLEIDEQDPAKLIDIIASLGPSFGGINLEDIKAPDCFTVEEELRARMDIPVFHDDQHGTAIVVAAAVINGLEIVGKRIGEVKIVTSGAGAAAIACMNMLIAVGAKRENIWLADSKGLVTEKRRGTMDRWRTEFAQHSEATELADVMDGADIYVGLSKAGALQPDMLKRMARDPIVLALSNPIPEIMPELAQATRPDSIICTGRSDYPNQVNNVLCFPFLFRGALDCGASTINEPMKAAAAHAIADLARGGGDGLQNDRIIPDPFDPRLISVVAPAVAKAAAESGVARWPIEDLAEYAEKLKTLLPA